MNIVTRYPAVNHTYARSESRLRTCREELLRAIQSRAPDLWPYGPTYFRK